MLKANEPDKQPKIAVVHLKEATACPGISGLKTLSAKDNPGLKLEMFGDSGVKYSIKNMSGVVFNPKAIVFE